MRVFVCCVLLTSFFTYFFRLYLFLPWLTTMFSQHVRMHACKQAWSNRPEDRSGGGGGGGIDQWSPCIRRGLHLFGIYVSLRKSSFSPAPLVGRVGMLNTYYVAVGGALFTSSRRYFFPASNKECMSALSTYLSRYYSSSLFEPRVLLEPLPFRLNWRR